MRRINNLEIASLAAIEVIFKVFVKDEPCDIYIRSPGLVLKILLTTVLI